MTADATGPLLRALPRMTVEDDGCLLWQGRVNRTVPTYGGQSVRRLLWEHANGPLDDHSLVVVAEHEGIRCDCRCVSHLTIWTNSKMQFNATRQPKAAGYHRRLAGAMKRADIKLNMDIARAMRADPRTCEQVAKDWGCSEATVQNVRKHKSWKEHAPGRSVFDLVQANRRNVWQSNSPKRSDSSCTSTSATTTARG